MSGFRVEGVGHPLAPLGVAIAKFLLPLHQARGVTAERPPSGF